MKKLAMLLLLLFPAAALQASPYSYYRVIEGRDIFRPLWNLNSSADAEEQKALAAEKARQEEEKRQRELKEQEIKQALEAKRAELEQSYALSGVVFNGTSLYALITDRRTNHGAEYMEGDSLAGAKVAQIDEKTQTVTLDFDGKFTVKLKIAK
jgi:hypothetical protein